MPPLIPTLPGSHLHRANVELYLRHRPDNDGRCLACGHPAPCEVAKYAGYAIGAAGEDPRWYDGQLVPELPAPDLSGRIVDGDSQVAPWRDEHLPTDPLLPPGVVGYRLGNRQRVGASFAAYER